MLRTRDRSRGGNGSGGGGVPTIPFYADAILWHDASDTASITDTGTLTWLDKSVSGYNSTQSSTGNKPVSTPAGLNGLNTLRFDGVDDFMVMAAGLLNLNNINFTMIMVNACTSTTAGMNFIGGENAGVSNIGFQYTSATNFRARAGVNNAAINPSPRDTTGHVFVMTAGDNGVNNVKGFYNGGAVTGTATRTKTNLSVIEIGRAFSFAGYFGGDIAEIIIYNRVLNDDEIDEVCGTGGLATKWNLPYTNLAPMAAAAPEVAADNASFLGSGGNTRYTNSGNLGFTSGQDWSVSFWMSCPAAGQSGFIFAANAGSTNGNNSFYIHYDKVLGSLFVSGRDSVGNHLGQQLGGHASINARGLRSDFHIPIDQPVHVEVQRVGNLAQLWLTFPGHAPVKVDESITSYGTVTTTSTRFGADLTTSNFYWGVISKFAKLSYSLTEAQILSIVNGTDPTTLGTTTATDFYLLFDAAVTPITSTINSISYTRSGTAQSIVTGMGYAPQSDGVFLNPYGWGKVFQHTAGSAVVPISGRYVGAAAGIRVTVLDQDGVAFVAGQTVATGSGGVWSANITIPKNAKYIKLQLRKTGSRQVMQTTVLFGVGVTLVLSGQSSMQKMEDSALPYGESVVTPNGLVSFVDPVPSAVSRSGALQIAVVGITNNNGRCQIQVGSDGHGLYVGSLQCIAGVVGTTEVNGQIKPVYSVVDKSNYVIDVPFVNAYVSGGVMYDFKPMHKIYSEASGDATPDGHVIIGNYLSSQHGCPVQIYNGSVGASTIEQHNQFTGGSGINLFGITTLLAGHALGKIGAFFWRHGHANIGQAQYYSGTDGVTPGGSEGARTGFGALGILYDFYKNNIPNNSAMKFGLMMFPNIAGNTSLTSAETHSFRFGMDDWVTRKIAAGDSNVYNGGWLTDLQPQWENGTSQNSHLHPGLKGYASQAARIGHAAAYMFGAVSNDSCGPVLLNGTRSGAVLTLPVTQNGGTTLRVLTPGAKASGFECSTSPSFSSLLTISSISVGTNIVITLSADPAATVYVRYMYGKAGQYASNEYMTPRITGVADNGSGLIRVTCATSPLSPVGSQKGGIGHRMVTGDWGTIEGVKGATQANGTWEVIRIDDTNIDLVGSSSVGLGTFVAGETLWQTSATPTINIEMGVPIYDDRTIGGYDTNGAPLRPTYTYVTAS